MVVYFACLCSSLKFYSQGVAEVFVSVGASQHSNKAHQSDVVQASDSFLALSCTTRLCAALYENTTLSIDV